MVYNCVFFFSFLFFSLLPISDNIFICWQWPFRIDLNWIESIIWLANLNWQNIILTHPLHTNFAFLKNPLARRTIFSFLFVHYFPAGVLSSPQNFVWIHGTGLKYVWNTWFLIKNVYHNGSYNKTMCWSNMWSGEWKVPKRLWSRFRVIYE